MTPAVDVRELTFSAWQDAVATRRDIHRYPELGWREFRTAAVIADQLDALGLAVEWGRALIGDVKRLGAPSAQEAAAAMAAALVAGAPERWLAEMGGGYTAVMASIDSGRPGPVLALRFDIDALPIAESDDPGHLPCREGFASAVPGVMHACGHDGHVAVGLAVAKVLHALRHRWSGTVRLIFQPAEEGVRGGSTLAQAGVVKGASHLIATHLGLSPAPTGSLVAGATKFFATRKLRFQFHGAAAHAALAPEKGRNALLAAATAALNLHVLPQHSKGPTRLNVGVLRAGVAANIVPAAASLVCELRAADDEVLSWLSERAVVVAESSALMHGCVIDTEVLGTARAQDSSPGLAQTIAEVARTVPRVADVQVSAPFGASDDATELMAKVIGDGGCASYLIVGAGLRGDHHQPGFDFDERAMLIAIDVLTSAALEILGQDE